MSAARELLDGLRHLGAHVAVEAGALVIEAGQRPVPGEMIAKLKAVKPELLRLITGVDHKRDVPTPTAPSPTARTPADAIERAAIIEHDGGHSTREAERHAREGWNPADWRHWLDELVTRRRRLGDSEQQAQAWAYGAALSEWHARHGIVPGAGQCAGCGKPLAGATVVLTWPDGARIHDSACAARWGAQWRGKAAEGLARLGIAAPKEVPL